MFPSHKTDKGRYILLPAFYARESALKLDEAALFIFVVILFTLGHVLVAVCYAVAGEDLSTKLFLLYVLNRRYCIYLLRSRQSLLSSLLGLSSILYNIWSSHNYVWCPTSLAGTTISGTSVLLYTTLLIWERRCTYISRKRCEYVRPLDEANFAPKSDDPIHRRDQSFFLELPGVSQREKQSHTRSSPTSDQKPSPKSSALYSDSTP